LFFPSTTLVPLPRTGCQNWKTAMTPR
jgi:hypothetical protein